MNKEERLNDLQYNDLFEKQLYENRKTRRLKYKKSNYVKKKAMMEYLSSKGYDYDFSEDDNHTEFFVSVNCETYFVTIYHDIEYALQIEWTWSDVKVDLDFTQKEMSELFDLLTKYAKTPVNERW